MPFDICVPIISFRDLFGKSKPPADPFEFSTFIDWLRKRPDDELYIYSHGQSCLCARYFTEKLGKPIVVNCSSVFELNDEGMRTIYKESYPLRMDEVARCGMEYVVGPLTMGDAKAYARKQGWMK